MQLLYLLLAWFEKEAVKTGNQIAIQIMNYITIRSPTPQHHSFPRLMLNTCTEASSRRSRELWQEQAFLKAENLAAPNFHNTISKPPTKDTEPAQVIFHCLLCYHQKIFRFVFHNLPKFLFSASPPKSHPKVGNVRAYVCFKSIFLQVCMREAVVLHNICFDP